MKKRNVGLREREGERERGYGMSGVHSMNVESVGKQMAFTRAMRK